MSTTLAPALVPEFDHEAANTRKLLERLPDDKLAWKAHPKSNTIGWVASHLVEIVGWFPGILEKDSWDVHPVGGEPYRTPVLNNRQEILDLFDRNVAAGRKALAETSDSEFMQSWSLLAGGEPIFTLPRIGVVRTYGLSHLIHHRAMLCVYLRLVDVPVPGMYGPSGDE